jgi:hypothetical protein
MFAQPTGITREKRLSHFRRTSVVEENASFPDFPRGAAVIRIRSENPRTYRAKSYPGAISPSPSPPVLLRSHPPSLRRFFTLIHLRPLQGNPYARRR